MQQAVNGVVRSASADCEHMSTADFTFRYHAQVSLIGIQIKWTIDCEDALYRSKAEKGVMNATAKKKKVRMVENRSSTYRHSYPFLARPQNETITFSTNFCAALTTMKMELRIYKTY